MSRRATATMENERARPRPARGAKERSVEVPFVYAETERFEHALLPFKGLNNADLIIIILPKKSMVSVM
jgi:hypothetical protein